MRKNTHKDQWGIQVFIVFPHEVMVVLVSFTLEPIVELGTGAARGSEEVWKWGWKYPEHTLQTGEGEHGQQKFGDKGDNCPYDFSKTPTEFFPSEREKCSHGSVKLEPGLGGFSPSSDVTGEVPTTYPIWVGGFPD